MKIKEVPIVFMITFCFLVLAVLSIFLDPNRIWTINDFMKSISIK